MSSSPDNTDLVFWESLSILDDQHWAARSFKGRGDLEFSGCLRFSGEWKGSVRSTATGAHLYVLSGARLSGSIAVEKLTVEGQLQDADVQVDFLRAVKGCRINGRVRARSMVIEEGAIIEGRLVSEAAKAPEPTP
jgi:cytoskeletal protein CcmA (bactofilin family)